MQSCKNPKALIVPNDVKLNAYKNGLLNIIQRKQHSKSCFCWSIGH